MSEVSYKPIISDMTWSYSRLNSFDECPYKWFMKYIKEYKDIPMFYAEYGKFIHELIEGYYNGTIPKNKLSIEFLSNFSTQVKGLRPQSSIVKKYLDLGLKYFNEFKPFPYETIAVEERFDFEIRGIPFIGFIDYVGKNDDEFIIIDNKSRDLLPRSGRKKPTKKDKELDDMLKQLYVYSAAIKQRYGKYPKYLCFNCFKNGMLIKEQFDIQKYYEVEDWVEETVRRIEDAEDFDARPDFFKCKYLCGVNDCCDFKD